MRGARAAAVGAALAAAFTAGGAGAQTADAPNLARTHALVARGDTMLLAGRLFGAESAYYAAARLSPRDPMARLALGRYLAGRGRLKVGAVLMEEARYFGGDPHAVAVEIAPVYARLGEWASLASLPSTAISTGERLRAQYLSASPPAIEGPDSSVVGYAVSDSHLLGRVKLALGTDTVYAVIDARAWGIVLDTSWMHRDSVKRFAPRGSRDPATVYGVVPRIQMGQVVFVNAPVRFQPLRAPGNALIGLDLLGALAPTFDPRVGFILVRKDGRVKDELPGWAIATFTAKNGVQVVKGDTMFPIGHPDVQQYFRVGKWTWDARRGEVVVDSVGVQPGGVTPPPT